MLKEFLQFAPKFQSNLLFFALMLMAIYQNFTEFVILS